MHFILNQNTTDTYFRNFVDIGKTNTDFEIMNKRSIRNKSEILRDSRGGALLS